MVDFNWAGPPGEPIWRGTIRASVATAPGGAGSDGAAPSRYEAEACDIPGRSSLSLSRVRWGAIAPMPRISAEIVWLFAHKGLQFR